jgi:hypothetical protein
MDSESVEDRHRLESGRHLQGCGERDLRYPPNGNETSQPLSSLLTMLKPKGRSNRTILAS